MQTTAFQGSPKLKQQMLDLTVAHREADRIAQGAYCHNGKMCAVGCTLNSYAAIRGVECDDHSEHKTLRRNFWSRWPYAGSSSGQNI